MHCTKCHGPESAKGGLRLDRREAAFGAGESKQKAIVPGDSAHSEVYRRITSHDSDERMPQKGERLSDAEIERVRLWINQGATWPDRDDYWVFQAPRSPPLPPGSAAHPIDRFISARLNSEKIAPAPRAEARTLMRRAYADLLGVPPSLSEATAYMSDTSPDAFEKLIDRLLVDPRYGERWARHWLDLARYSESDGFEDDKIRPLAWRYRDYVIRAFNADKPYSRFIEEQIAGDELFPDDPDAWIATGFARLGPWDGMSKDPPMRRQDFLNDATDATGSVFLGMTAGCARCHDHKFDRITQQDYYALQAFFAGTKRETRDLKAVPLEPAFVTEAREKEQAELQLLRTERDALLKEAREKIAAAQKAATSEKAVPKICDDQLKKKSEELHKGKLADLEKRIKERESAARVHLPAAEAVFEDSKNPPKTLLLKGGELSRPGPEIVPHFIEAMCAPGAAIPVIVPGKQSSGRRTALAHWLSSPENPLTARVMMNRLWQHHFGRGIVATPSDFGRHGQQPTHRELLDWLACRFVADGWSVKKMHRLIMTSDAYQRSSISISAAAERDPNNTLLWRANRRRLEAEALRDSMLVVSGRLSTNSGGPGVYPRISKDINVELPNNDKELSWYGCTDDENRRRTIYTFQRRSLTFPFVEVFDGAPMSQTCPSRAETTVAPQALMLLNGEFCREEARRMAERVFKEAEANVEARVTHAFQLAFARTPNTNELNAAKAYLIEQSKLRLKSIAQPSTGPVSVFTTQVPVQPNNADGVSYELGMKFQTNAAGRITAIRYYRSPSEPGSHLGRIWSTDGKVLASAEFKNETASGWQQAPLDTPLRIDPNATYIVTVNTNKHYADTVGGLAKPIVSGAISTVADNAASVFGDMNAFPTRTYQNSNYFRDVVFAPEHTVAPLAPKAAADVAAFADFCHVLFNTNEFMYLD